MFLHTLHQRLPKTLLNLGIGCFVQHPLEGNLDGVHHVRHLVEQIEILLHHCLIVARMLIQRGQFADKDIVILHLLPCM